MDPIEILGSLLGKKARGSGGGADILKDILLGGLRGQTSPQVPSQAPSRAPSREAAPRESSSRQSSAPREYREPAGNDIQRQARELEDLLNVATNRSAGRQAAPPTQSPAAQRQTIPAGNAPFAQNGAAQRGDSPFDDVRARQSQQALVLVQAMVNAAKCDGQISQAEQQAILNRLDNPSPETIQYLRDELAKPLDVREFAWSVPVGMEQQVYTMSLAAIDVDSDREQRYLRELAHGLRLSPEVCEGIKDQLMGVRPHASAR